MRASPSVLDTARQDWIHLVLAPVWALSLLLYAGPVLVGAGVPYGAVFGILGELSAWALSVTLVVSLMHFWHDGFVWSVRRKEA